MLVGLTVLNNKYGGGSGMWQIFISARTQTVMIEFYLKFEHDAFVYNTYFLIRSLLAKIRCFLKIRNTHRIVRCASHEKKEHFIFIFYVLLFTRAWILFTERASLRQYIDGTINPASLSDADRIRCVNISRIFFPSGTHFFQWSFHCTLPLMDLAIRIVTWDFSKQHCYKCYKWYPSPARIPECHWLNSSRFLIRL
jgi:hypothetical protein